MRRNPPRNLDSSTTITIDNRTFEVEADDLETLCELGRGAYGIVEKVVHRHTGTIMAVKRIPTSINNEETKRLLMDLDVLMRTSDCDYTVTFYGAMFREVRPQRMPCVCASSLYCCAGGCLDLHGGDGHVSRQVLPQGVQCATHHPGEHPQQNDLLCWYLEIVACSSIGNIGEVIWTVPNIVVRALHYLHSNLRVIHRDVKPSNVLISRQGRVKMCDFGISGYLVESVAKTVDAGCKPYMAPERINPEGNRQNYDIRSDVWSLGITLIEVATGNFPYETWGTPFDQLKQVVFRDPPRLPPGQFSKDFEDFIVR
ncbi:MAP2K3, partial [Cordylochernes scorpioides]